MELSTGTEMNRAGANDLYSSALVDSSIRNKTSYLSLMNCAKDF